MQCPLFIFSIYRTLYVSIVCILLNSFEQCQTNFQINYLTLAKTQLYNSVLCSSFIFFIYYFESFTKESNFDKFKTHLLHESGPYFRSTHFLSSNKFPPLLAPVDTVRLFHWRFMVNKFMIWKKNTTTTYFEDLFTNI